MLLYQAFAFTIHEKYKKVIKNNKFKISARKWNEEFEIPDVSWIKIILNIS